MTIHLHDGAAGGTSVGGDAIHGIPIAPAESTARDGDAPLTIVHVCAPAPFGGLERVVRALAAGQAERGHRVHVVAIVDAGTGDAHPFVAALRGDGVAVHPVEVAARAYRAERAAVRAILERLAADVVHTHGYRADVLHSGAARRLGAISASTVHGFTGGGWKNRLYERFQRLALRRHDAVFAVSHPLGAALAADGVPAARIHVVPNAWTPSAAPVPRVEARREFGLTEREMVIGWVGRISPEKGLDVMIDALPLLTDLPVRLVVLGDGPQRGAMVRRAASLGVAERVDFRGAVSDAGRWLTAFDAWVLSSHTEGTPVTLFEAIAAGVPVVSTAVGGVPDVVSPDEAILVPPDRPEALADALRAVAAAPLAAAARAARAGERVAAAFAAAPWLDAHDAAYRRALRDLRSTPVR
ncbi:MAG TPA: glycosyltransferase [Longimicrobium sp.]|nr:glycosyltransferase [Longimicrobium sp.]